MPIPENTQVNLPDSKEEKEVEAIEKKVDERASRKREQVEKMFVEHYKLEEGSDALKLLVDREMASSQSFDKLIKQKKKWRSMAQEKKDNGEEENKTPESKTQTDFDKIRGIEKTKATQDFLQGLIKDHPDKFTDKKSVADAYDKIMGEYKEKGDETRREDFKVNLEKAFKVSHPDIYEEKIKEQERKRLLEDDIDMPEGSGQRTGDGKKSTERRILGGVTVDPVKDWYRPKS